MTNRRFWRVLSLVILIAISAFCIFNLCFIVPKFEQIYAFAFPGRPLPGLTLFVLGSRYPLIAITALYPLAGMVLLRRNHPATLVCLNLGTLLGFIELALVTLALFLPMCDGIIVGMSESQR